MTDDSFNAAVDRVQAAVDSGQVVRFTGNDFAQPLTRGTFAASVAWSGDVVQLLADNPKLKWAIPKDGGMIWTDNMLIPTGGSVPTASTYMNYVYDPAVAARHRRVRSTTSRRSRVRRRSSRRPIPRRRRTR